ncbi:hypothetical protein EVAR_24782_1 [Eumeta japonica]|uniref:Uncharacterized protein n=1 Tax=Eumeta variegata TaxID=151549 RepID=A0A4C1W305_EUMVA|nr:hypothetical protein EVAR_24782_1 [Eumeta japonica]
MSLRLETLMVQLAAPPSSLTTRARDLMALLRPAYARAGYRTLALIKNGAGRPIHTAQPGQTSGDVDRGLETDGADPLLERTGRGRGTPGSAGLAEVELEVAKYKLEIAKVKLRAATPMVREGGDTASCAKGMSYTGALKIDKGIP